MNKVVVPLHRNVVSISINAIREPEFPVRSFYDDKALQELAESLEIQGMLAPILVTNIGEELYEVHVGSRRLKAARLKGFSKVPVVIVELDGPLEALILTLTENLQREDLDPFEEARAFLRLMREYGMQLKEIVSRVDKSEQYVRRRLELLALPEAVQQVIAEGTLGLHYVSPITGLPTGEEQVYYAEEVIKHGLTLQELRAIILKDKDGEPRAATKSRLTAQKVVARTEVFKRWIRRVPSKLDLSRMNADEILQVAVALRDLETVIEAAKELVRPSQEESTKSFGSSLPDDANNHGQEWPSGHIKRITASNRPPDEVLARDLGRTVAAIRQMRSKASR